MDEIQLKVKSWVDAITKERMAGVAKEMEEFLNGKLTYAENKSIFKVLLYLSHAAAKCGKTNPVMGREICLICRCICSKMTEIPDAKKFFASIYHIANCLLSMGLYKEALETTDHVLPGRLWKNESPDGAEMYTKIGNLISATTHAVLRKTRLTTRDSLDVVVALTRYELDLTNLAHASSARHVLAKILSYCERINAIDEKPARSLREEFQTSMLNYVGQSRICLDDEETKNLTYRLILRVVNAMIARDINSRAIGVAEENLPRYFDAFRGCLRGHDEHLRCYELYERWLIALVKPARDLSPRTEREIATCIVEHDSLRNSRVDPGAVREYSYLAFVSINELLVYWEEIARSENGADFLRHAINTTTMSFFRAHSEIFARYTPNNCRCDTAVSPRRCELVEDAYTGVAMMLKVLAVISRIFQGAASHDERIIRETLSLCESSRERIQLIRRKNCHSWKTLWATCGGHFYNIGVSCEAKHQEASGKIYALLLASFVEFEGLASLAGEAASIFAIRDPLPTILHRITSVEYKRERYESAMFHCALNALLSSRIARPTKIAKETNGKVGKSKIYSTWAFIKHRHPAARKFTMLKYLRSQATEIAKLLGESPRLEDYDLARLCLREIEGLANGPTGAATSITAVVDELERLRAPAAIYAQAVQWLGYHLLNHPAERSIAGYLAKATAKRERDAPATMSSRSELLRLGHLKFHEFCDRLRDLNLKTATEMENAIEAVESPAGANLGESATAAGESESLVPTYSAIRVGVTTKIAGYLENALKAWKRALDSGDIDRAANSLEKLLIEEKLEKWEIEQTLEMLIVAGEHARLYDLESLEIEAWKMAFRLARTISDHRAIVYITGRSLSSRRVDRRWIDAAEESVKKIENLDDARTKETILGYRLSLADLYYQNGDVDAGKEMFLRATPRLEDCFMRDDANFILGVHLRINQPSLAEDGDDQFAYSEILVRGLYSLLSMGDALEAPVRGDKTRQLRGYDRVFEFTNNLAPRMNGLLGFPEISAHLRRTLKMAQKLGASLRVAECLKSICYIDLARAKLDECEAKLQGLEHILEIENFEATMKSQPIPAIQRIDALAASAASIRLVETVRDVGQDGASPILREKVFATPDFMVHGELCRCFKCTNGRYRSLVFAATHIRAQLFSLRRNERAALDHFEGAMTIKVNILERRNSEADGIDDDREIGSATKKSKVLRARRHLDDVEHVAIHLDYCRFLRWAMPEKTAEGVEIAIGALELCERYNMQNHPLYVATNLLLFEYRFENAYDEADFSKFTVPAVDEINVDRFVATPRTLGPAGIPISLTTPVREEIAPKAMSVRKRKTPPFLRLKKVPIDLTEEEDEEKKEPAITTSPPARTRPIRRHRITETPQDSNQSDSKPERSKSAVLRMKFSIPSDEVEAASLANAKREKIARKPGNLGEIGNARKIDKIVEEIKPERTIAKSQRESSARSRGRKLSQRGSGDSSASEISEAPVVPTIKIDEVTDLLADLAVRKTRAARNSRAASSAPKIDEITLSSDGAYSSSDELETRRVSSRLRKKSQDSASMTKKNEPRRLDHSASNSEDEVVIIKTRTSRRRATSATEKSAASKE